MLNVNNSQNSPSFGAKVIQGKEFNRLGKFAKNELGPKLKAALKDYDGDTVTIKLGGKLNTTDSAINQVTAYVSDGQIFRQYEAFLNHFKPNHWAQMNKESQQRLANNQFKDFVGKLKCAIDDMV